jgi:ABC-type bacteriocin/lantibiotic exporter with double-glycine peptidase domain
MSDILQVPHYQQLANGYCLPACVQMVLAYWGVPADQAELAQKLQMIPGAGTPGSRLNLLASRSLSVSYGEGELHDLQEALSIGVPPIALVFTGELPYWDKAFAHAVVILNIDTDTVVLHDPGKVQSYIVIPTTEFQLAWDAMANLFGILTKK